MGATPTGITVALALPPSTPLAWLLEVYKGLTACLEPWQTPILGVMFPDRRLKLLALRFWVKCLRVKPCIVTKPKWGLDHCHRRPWSV
ncbi:AIR synthase related protein [Synechocystis sp. B12]|nr:AIR synthase related protein [Synechocystis sp. B12]